MDLKMLLAALCLLSVSVSSLASTSIAKDCYNKNSSFASSNPSNNKYLTYMIVMGVIGILASFGAGYMATKVPAAVV